jgi:exopolyphosphatase/guanosine-5'-triphosphate,3'-diphosphate pyrophosphatase
MKRVAVIDCGTNTFNLRIVDFSKSLGPGRWKNVFSLRLPVKLGKGGVGKGIILKERITRGLDAIGVMKEAIQNYSADDVSIFATSALRDASNSQVFVDAVRNLHGYEVNIISGAAEAAFIQKGLELTYSPAEGENVLTMDIGGGSTECILWNTEEIIWSRSFNVGVARMGNLFKYKDRFGADADEAYQAMLPYLDDALEPLKIALENTNPSILIGSSGSFDTFCSITNPNIPETPEDRHPPADSIEIPGFIQLCSDLMHNSLRDRLAMKGMPPDRADNIPYAAAITRWVMSKCEFTSMFRSHYALREGVLNKMSCLD